jgi:hypothetical protein
MSNFRLTFLLMPVLLSMACTPPDPETDGVDVTDQATTASGAPKAPSNLKATPWGFTPSDTVGIDLTWKDNSSNEQEFIVEVSTDNKKWSELTRTPRTHYRHTTARLDQAYHYKVSASNSKGRSSAAKADGKLPDDMVVKLAKALPLNDVAQSVTGNQFNVFFDSPNGTGMQAAITFLSRTDYDVTFLADSAPMCNFGHTNQGGDYGSCSTPFLASILQNDPSQRDQLLLKLIAIFTRDIPVKRGLTDVWASLGGGRSVRDACDEMCVEMPSVKRRFIGFIGLMACEAVPGFGRAVCDWAREELGGHGKGSELVECAHTCERCVKDAVEFCEVFHNGGGVEPGSECFTFVWACAAGGGALLRTLDIAKRQDL